MLISIATYLLLGHSGIATVGNQAVGLVRNGKWVSMDSIYTKDWPKRTITDGTVAKFNAGPRFTLGADCSIAPSRQQLSFHGEDEGPGGGWHVSKFGEQTDVVWFGPKPAKPKVTFTSSTNPLYVAAARNYLRRKGFAHTNPHLNTVAIADLDANGTNEAVVFITSRDLENMSGTMQLMEKPAHPDDYAAVIIRSISKGQVKTTEVYYTDGKRSGLDGYCMFAGLWDLDGKPGLELLYAYSGYEAWSGAIVGFRNGKVLKLAEAGGGV